MEKNKNHGNEEWLREHYCEKGLSGPKIAKLCGLKDEQVVYNNLEKFGIPRRGFVEAALLVWDSKGKRLPGTFCSKQMAYKEARRVWEEWHMRPLPKGWVVHHMDYNPWNNEIWNLWAMPRSTHNRIHKSMIPRKKRQRKYIKQVDIPQHTQGLAQVAV